MKKKFFTLVFLLALSPLVWAQQPKVKDWFLGSYCGYGSQFFMTLPYNYSVFQVQTFSQKNIVQQVNWSLALRLGVEFGLSWQEVTPSQKEKGIETGLHGGLFLNRKIIKHLSLMLGLSIGPHYVNMTPDRQIPGFIFSDNLHLGFSYQATPNLALTLSSNFRHISNANIAAPNGGVNTLFFHVGMLQNMNL